VLNHNIKYRHGCVRNVYRRYDRPVPADLRPVPDGDDSPNQLTIEGLAHETGLSVRNLRSHQARGLLPPPEVRGRVGYYGPAHVERLRLIQELQAEGLKLEGIKRLLEESDGSGEGLLRVKRAADAFEEPESSEVITLEELDERLGIKGRDRDKMLDKAVKLGILVPLGSDLFEVPRPSLLATAEEVVGRGITLPHALGLFEELDRHAHAVSQNFVKMFVDDVWQPFSDAGLPDSQWTDVAEAMEELRPLAGQAVLTVFRKALSEEVEATFAEITKKLAAGKR
jgi:DNA-binding transcriptional MerR regulator